MKHSPKILIVDDDPVMAGSVRAILQDRGYDIEIMNNPRKALDKINRALYDIVILDVMMPEMTGFELLEAFDRENVDTFFIIMTGNASMESAVKAIRKGASDFFKKPFDPDELIIRVDSVLKLVEMNQRRIQAEKEQQKLEVQLGQARKMEAIGTLAGGIAHDFNNILGIIMGNTELMMEDMEPSHPSLENLEKVMVASFRAKEMINQLLRFSRQKDSEQKPIELNTIILDSLKLLRASIPTNIEIQTEISETAYTVLGDTTQINQIMINLCTNAAHAMQASGGILLVKLNHVDLKNNVFSEHSDIQEGEYIQLIVADTGHGISTDTIERIFDPYFTTKEQGKGTGMGLAVVHGIVKKHGGDIQVFSEMGVGTEFHILLPTINAEEVASEATAIDSIPKGKERIMLVDDEEMIADMMTQMLKKLGYQVTGYTQSSSALDVFQKSPQNFDLLITDMTMPTLTGDLLAKEIKEIRSDIPVILCTGFSEQCSDRKRQDPNIQAIIMKPIGMQSLAETIREVLDKHIQERRKDTRYGLKTDTFIISKTDPRKRAEVIDISRSGFSFQYAEDMDIPDRSEKFTIRTMDERFALDDISFETISDVTANPGAAAHSSLMRRRGGRFSELTPFQDEQLVHFIDHVAVNMKN